VSHRVIILLYVIIITQKKSSIAVGDDDVHLKVLFCGMCHSDIHQVKGEWNNSTWPMIPGHEITGIVEKVGSNVTKFKPGDKCAVGCMVNSCQSCKQCTEHHCEQYCPQCVFTYNGKDFDGSMTMGGYSTHMVVNEKFVLRFPDNLPMDAGAPLLCAGITVYSPMKHYGLDKEGLKLAVIGLGGLGHMAVKLGKAMGMHVTVVSTHDGKKADAMERLGADAFLVSSDPGAMAAAQGTFDGLIDTVSAKHDFGFYCSLLDTNGKYILVGVPPEPFQVGAFSLLGKRITFGGSLIGGIKETQEMLDLCGAKNIVAEIEKVPMDYVNTAFERMMAGDVKYRFVLDLSTM
jgi:D-arabinose 1-dehydrogenase-like Zn-dependent alcohol dehydrogenase